MKGERRQKPHVEGNRAKGITPTALMETLRLLVRNPELEHCVILSNLAFLSIYSLLEEIKIIIPILQGFLRFK